MSIKIVAIGGGENGRKGYSYETKEIDVEIVKLTDLENPNFLFIGFASGKFEDSYFNVMNKIYSDLGCNTDILKLDDLNNILMVKEKIEKANIIYVGGGNTLKLMTLIRKYNIDNLLKNSIDKGTVLCGVSAGRNMLV